MLDRIVQHKKEELKEHMNLIPLASLEKQAQSAPPVRGFRRALEQGGVRLIAEVKRASPSKGIFREDLDAVTTARVYEQNGASAISVLTDAHFFKGSLEDLKAVREAVGIPVLRKDFILEPYQVYEARAWGADAILLIVAILEQRQLTSLFGLAGELGMDCLVEVHDGPELERALESGASVIGVNNRNLKTFKTDIRTTLKLSKGVPSDKLLVSESGIRFLEDIRILETCGVRAVLVGEALITSEDMEKTVRKMSSLSMIRG
ncbi:MAG: indole-3-glycerol phosphate synthase TrpC [Bacillota bacterium]